VPADDVHRAIQAIFRIESPRLIAALVRLTRDVGQAEELAQDSLVAALETWPTSGVPDRPGAWLAATARNRALDRRRREKRLEARRQENARDLEAREADQPDPTDSLDDPFDDDLLRLVFVACHPVLPTEARVALTLRLLGGLTTGEIARAFLIPEPTVAQRSVRARRALAEAGVPFEVPAGGGLATRLDAVLEVVYLIFNEGHAATAGDDLIRPALCEDALRLGRILAGLMPREPEVHGLVALMELHASRLGARTDAAGAPVLLLDQDRARWDQLLIGRGLTALERAEALSGPLPGPYALQAAIAACHARARTADETPWPRIAALYGALAAQAPSPVVELNRAVAVGMAEGPAAGLALADRLEDEPALRRYHLLPAVRGDLLARLGRHEEARTEFERAAALTRNGPERALLSARAADAARRAREA